jgi:hypothetical protein
MKQITKDIHNNQYVFSIDTEQNSSDFLTVVVHVIPSQQTQFEKLFDKKVILKQIATDAAEAINKNFRFFSNPDDSGSQWHGLFKLTHQ